MTKQAKITATVRTELGKGPTGRLRREGRVPAVMYGHEVTPTAVHVDGLELYHALHTEAGRNVMFRLEIEGETHLSIAREIQRHPLMGDITHLDFLAVDRNVAIVVEVPVHLQGSPADPVAVVQQVLTTVAIKVKPLDVPNELVLDIEGLSIGDVLRVGDLTLPEGCEADMDADRTIVTINAPTIEVVEDETEASDEFAGEGGDEGSAPAADEASAAE